MVVTACGAEGGSSPDLEVLARRGQRLIVEGLGRVRPDAPLERVAWGGLTAASVLGLGVLLERSVGLRRRRIIPSDFATRFLERLQEGRLDRGKCSTSAN